MNLARKGTIISITKIAKRTIEVTIKVPQDFNFTAGQYIWLQIPQLTYPDPKGNTRMFSIASSPSKKGELDIMFRTSESGYKRTLTEMMPGATILFSGPFGPLELPKDNTLPVVLIAGGVGVAPFLSMIRFANETHSGHGITLIYANASKQETAYVDELSQMEKENPSFKLSRVFGLLKKDQLEKTVHNYNNQKTFWAVIGPKGFVDIASNYLSELGIPLQNVIFEQFYPNVLLKQ